MHLLVVNDIGILLQRSFDTPFSRLVGVFNLYVTERSMGNAARSVCSIHVERERLQLSPCQVVSRIFVYFGKAATSPNTPEVVFELLDRRRPIYSGRLGQFPSRHGKWILRAFRESARSSSHGRAGAAWKHGHSRIQSTGMVNPRRPPIAYRHLDSHR